MPALLAKGGAMVIVGMPPVGTVLDYEPMNMADGSYRNLGSSMRQTDVRRDIPWLVELYRQGRLKLDEADIPYMLVGSLASSVHGAPRATQDIDIVVDLDEQSLERLLESLPADRYYLDFVMAQEALAARRPFNMIELASGWKADLIVRKDRASSVEEFDRRVSARVQGTEVRIASPEESVLSTLEWATPGESERLLRDAAGVIAVQGESLDRGCVERRVRALGLEEEWRRLLAKVDRF